MIICRALLARLAAAGLLLLAAGALAPAAVAGQGAGAPAAGPALAADPALAAAPALVLGRAPAPLRWVDPAGATRLALAGDDAASGLFPLGFAFPFYGQYYDRVAVSANGLLTFQAGAVGWFAGAPLPDPLGPGALLAPFWADLFLHPDSAVLVHQGGQRPQRWWAATWERAGLAAEPAPRITFHRGWP